MRSALLASLLVLARAAPVGAAHPTAPQERPGVSVRGPLVVLSEVGFRLDLELRGDAAEPYAVFTALGRELTRGVLEPGVPLATDDLRIEGRRDTPLVVRLGAAGRPAGTFDSPVLPGWTSLLPPLVAIVLALAVREVLTSLFLGVWLGSFLYTGLNPVTGTMRAIDRFIVPALADLDHASILIFSFLLGGMVGVISRSGGTRGIVEAVRPLATSPRRAQLATYLSGLAIFFDDYANTLIVGNTMRPITDRMKVSREKLAYIVDSTAAPVAAIVFVSTGVGFEISLIGDGLANAAAQVGTDPAIAASLLEANPFTVFIHSIPYLFYPLLALLMVGLIILTQRDFGPMLAAEQRASRGEGLYREGAMLLSELGENAMEPDEGTPLRWYNAVLPVMTVILVVLCGLYFEGRATLGRPGTLWEVFGEANPFHALLWGSLAGCLVAVALAVVQRILGMTEAIQSLVGGMRAMLLAGIILILAWSLSDVTAVLGTAAYISGLLEGSLRPELLPVLVFASAAAISFATGTSWGTMAILIPLVVPLSVAIGGGAGFDAGSHYTIVLGSISSVLAGAIFGDHCSPISDTTVLSSMASACDHVDHVRTQLPYALVVALVGMAAGDIPTAFGMPPVLSYLMGGTVLFLLLRFVGKHDYESPQWERGGADAGS